MIGEIEGIIFYSNFELLCPIVDGLRSAFGFYDEYPIGADDQMIYVEIIKGNIVVDPIGMLRGANDLIQLLTDGKLA